MADSDDDDVLFSASGSKQQTRGLLGNGVKNVDDVMNGPKEDRRLKKTLALCSAFLGLGLAIAILGPTLPSLKEQLAVTYAKISYVFVGRSVGYLAGSIVGGVMFEWFHPSLLMAGGLLACGVGLIAAPFCSALWSLALLISMVGLAMGTLDTGANVVCLRLWGKKSSPFIQALHFCFAVGAFLAPLLAAPFIATAETAPSATAVSSLSNSTEAQVLMTTSNMTLWEITSMETIESRITDLNVTLSPNDTSVKSAPNKSTTTVSTTTVSTTTASATAANGTAANGTAANGTAANGTAANGTAASGTAASGTAASGTAASGTAASGTAASGTATSGTATSGKKRRAAERQVETSQELDVSTGNGTLKDAPSRRFRSVYVIIGVVNALVSGAFFYFFCTSPVKPPPPVTDGQAGNGKNKDFKNIVLVLMFIFYFLYVGAEISFGGYIFTFATECQLQFDKATASLLNSAFWGAFATGRGLSICLASVLSPQIMLILDIVGCLISSSILSWYGESNSTVLWIGTMMLGLSMASLFPAGISWLESYYKVTGSMATVLIVGSAFGEMFFPMVIGQMLRQPLRAEGSQSPSFLLTGPIGLMYFMLATSGLTAIIFVVMQYLAKQHGVEQKELRKSNAAEDIKRGVHEAISMEEIFPKGNAKQSTKIVIPKPLRVKKHNE